MLCVYFLPVTMSPCLDCIRYGAQLIVEGDITFEQLMTAMLALMLGALGLGQALNDLGDLLHPCLPTYEPSSNPLFVPLSLYCYLPSFLPKLTLLSPTPFLPTPLLPTPLPCSAILTHSSLPILGPSGDQKEGLLAAKRIFTSIDSGNTSLCLLPFFLTFHSYRCPIFRTLTILKTSVFHHTTSHHTALSSPSLTTLSSPHLSTLSSPPLTSPHHTLLPSPHHTLLPSPHLTSPHSPPLPSQAKRHP